MANIKGGEKRARQAIKRRQKNRSERSAIHTMQRTLLTLIAAGDKEKTRLLFREYCSLLDKAVKHGVLMGNTGDRKKSRMATKLAGMK